MVNPGTGETAQLAKCLICKQLEPEVNFRNRVNRQQQQTPKPRWSRMPCNPNAGEAQEGGLCDYVASSPTWPVAGH